jgi:PAS domain S-box-containing protein
MSNKPTYEELAQRVEELEQDTLKHHQIEETQQENNILHSTMISNIGDVIGIMGSDGIMKYKSPNIERWFGWKPDDLVGSNGWHTVHPEDIERIQKEFIKVLEKDNTQTKIEYRYKCKDETYTWIELTAFNCINNPAINGVLLNYHDITERRQAEEALRRSEEKHRYLLESIDDWVWSIDLKGVHTFSNKAVESMLGYKVCEILGTSSYPIIHTDDQERIQEVVQKSIKNKEGWENLEIRWIHKNGSIRYITSSSKPIFDGENLIGFSGIDLDITERKLAEEKLKSSDEKYRLLFESSKDAILILDPEIGYIDCNNTALEMFRISSKDEFLKATPVDLSPKYQPDGLLLIATLFGLNPHII